MALNDSNAVTVALDFADKYEAVSVTIETDYGTLTMSPQRALEEYEAYAPGESFSILSISFDNN